MKRINQIYPKLHAKVGTMGGNYEQQIHLSQSGPSWQVGDHSVGGGIRELELLFCNCWNVEKQVLVVISISNAFNCIGIS